MQVIAIFFKTFCIPMSTGALKGSKLLKMPSNSISECNFSKFPEGMPPDLPSKYWHALHTMTEHIPATPTSIMVSHLVVPPLFQKSRSVLGSLMQVCPTMLLASVSLWYSIVVVRLSFCCR